MRRRTRKALVKEVTAEIDLVRAFDVRPSSRAFLPAIDARLLSMQLSLRNEQWLALEGALGRPLPQRLRSLIEVACSDYLICMAMGDRLPQISRYLRLLVKRAEKAIAAIDRCVANLGENSPAKKAGEREAAVHLDRILSSHFRTELEALGRLKYGLASLIIQLQAQGAKQGPGRPEEVHREVLFQNLVRVAEAAQAELKTLSHSERVSGKSTGLIDFVRLLLVTIKTNGPALLCTVLQGTELKEAKTRLSKVAVQVNQLTDPIEKVVKKRGETRARKSRNT